MLRPLGVKQPLPQFQGIQKLSLDEFKEKIGGASNVQGPDPNEEPKTIDPLTGKMITVSESKAKYGDGTKLIFVKIDGATHAREDGTQTRGMGKIERITIAEYQRRYYNYNEPPKAAETIQELLGHKPGDATQVNHG